MSSFSYLHVLLIACFQLSSSAFAAPLISEFRKCYQVQEIKDIGTALEVNVIDQNNNNDIIRVDKDDRFYKQAARVIPEALKQKKRFCSSYRGGVKLEEDAQASKPAEPSPEL